MLHRRPQIVSVWSVLIIAYSACVALVESGQWLLYRYNPDRGARCGLACEASEKT